MPPEPQSSSDSGSDDDDDDYTQSSELPFLSRTSVMLTPSVSRAPTADQPTPTKPPAADWARRSFSFHSHGQQPEGGRGRWLRTTSARLLGGGAGAVLDRDFQAGPDPLVILPSCSSCLNGACARLLTGICAGTRARTCARAPRSYWMFACIVVLA